MTRSYNLFLDDLREPSDAFKYTQDSAYVDKEWEVVRSYDEFVDFIVDKYINHNDLPALISFDHDLADEHYYREPDEYEKFTEKTGYDCAKWIINFCLDSDISLPECKVHSMNPVGKHNIRTLLENFVCDICGGEGYHKMSCPKIK